MPHLSAGEILRSHRKRQHLTQAEVASQAQIHEVTVSRIESGSPTSASTLARLARALRLDDVETAELLRCAGRPAASGLDAV